MRPKNNTGTPALAALFFIALAINLAVIPQVAEAALMNASVTIGNDPPTLGPVTCCFKDADASSYSEANCRDEGSTDGYLPSGGKPYDMMCNFTVSDSNGYQDMTDGWVNMTWYYYNVSWNGPLSNDTLYVNNSCRNVTSSASGTDINYECLIPNIRYWADAGNWTVLLNISDGQAYGTPHRGYIQIGAMKSIWQSTTIPFGQMNIGENGSQGHMGKVAVSSTTNNTGNTVINIQASGGTDYMNCTVGAIPINSIKYDLQQDQPMQSACGNLTASPDWDCAPFQLPDCSGSCPNLASIKYTYWGVAVPNTGVGGVCSRIITIIAT